MLLFQVLNLTDKQLLKLSIFLLFNPYFFRISYLLHNLMFKYPQADLTYYIQYTFNYPRLYIPHYIFSRHYSFIKKRLDKRSKLYHFN